MGTGDRDGVMKDSPHCVDEKVKFQRSDLLIHIFIFKLKKKKKSIPRSSDQVPISVFSLGYSVTLCSLT